MVADNLADMGADLVDGMVADKKMADMELDMVADMEVGKVADKVADMEVDKVADMAADMFKANCIKPEMF